MTTKPIKRHDAIQPISREHHHCLLLCWKIREGFKKNIETERIAKYTNWFWENYLKYHFSVEEKYLFPILPAQDKLVQQAIQEHSVLRSLFQTPDKTEETLTHIEQKLVEHIRFEERTLFNAIQECAKADQLQLVKEKVILEFDTEWEDEFWW
ncbi:MAG: hemerythrin domain-containing protein [Bacteroidia bacterium]|nr:hemerythrin domain-containing protein [Bacteroidia bacterium]MCZ2140770.1 hemerythrin domain-containing protein [Bacteroidia bacterium]